MYRAAGLNARLGVEPAILADEAQRVDRLAIAPQLDRDFGTRLAGDAERGAGDELIADRDVAARQAGDEAGPAAGCARKRSPRRAS